MFKKNNAGNLQSELEEVTNLLKNFENESSNGMQTIKIKNIEFYMEKYKKLRKSITSTADKTSKRYSLLIAKCEELKSNIVYQYLRNFEVKDNHSIYAKKLEYLPFAIEAVEKQFSNEVAKAQEYFGSFLEKEFHFGILVTETEQSHTVKEILNSPDRLDWSCHIIERGFPQPCWTIRFNKMLKQCVEDFVENV